MYANWYISFALRLRDFPQKVMYFPHFSCIPSPLRSGCLAALDRPFQPSQPHFVTVDVLADIDNCLTRFEVAALLFTYIAVWQSSSQQSRAQQVQYFNKGDWYRPWMGRLFRYLAASYVYSNRFDYDHEFALP